MLHDYVDYPLFSRLVIIRGSLKLRRQESLTTQPMLVKSLFLQNIYLASVLHSSKLELPVFKIDHNLQPKAYLEQNLAIAPPTRLSGK